MEFIEARALKSSALSQMAVKPNCNDDVWGIHTLPPSDDNFPVEDLLNLDQLDDDDHHDDHDPQFDHERNSNFSSTTTFSGAADEFDSLSAAGQLAIPPDDFEDLEWLSQFVDDSPTELSLLCPVGSFTAVSRGKSIETVNRPVRMMRVPFLPSPVPRKARSYRPTRPSCRRPWYLSSSPTLSAAESSTTTSSNGSSVLPPLPVVVFGGKPSVFEADWFCSVEKPPPAKKQKKSTPEADLGRKCTHCQVNKTPQWRTGPQGPKTLCNACGVRYKSGRLFPEYRPACSPTFSKEAHSNSHRKVLEMRRKKETTTQGC